MFLRYIYIYIYICVYIYAYAQIAVIVIDMLSKSYLCRYRERRNKYVLFIYTCLHRYTQVYMICV